MKIERAGGAGRSTAAPQMSSTSSVFLTRNASVCTFLLRRSRRIFLNDPPSTAEPDAGLCDNFNVSTGCGYSPATGCAGATGPGLAMQDHEIFAVTWSAAAGAGTWLAKHRASSRLPGSSSAMVATTSPDDDDVDGGPVVDVANLTLTSGERVSPLVWSPVLQSPTGRPLKDVGLRVVNRTDFYRCHLPAAAAAAGAAQPAASIGH